MELNLNPSNVFLPLNPGMEKAELNALRPEHEMMKVIRRPGGRVVGRATPMTEEEQLRKAAEDFESVFLFQMLKQIRNTIHKEGFLSGGNAEEMFTGMLDEELAKVMAGANSTGLSEMIYQQMRRIQGAAAPESSQNLLPGTTPQAEALRGKMGDAAAATRAVDAAAAAIPSAGRGVGR